MHCMPDLIVYLSLLQVWQGQEPETQRQSSAKQQDEEQILASQEVGIAPSPVAPYAFKSKKPNDEYLKDQQRRNQRNFRERQKKLQKGLEEKEKELSEKVESEERVLESLGYQKKMLEIVLSRRSDSLGFSDSDQQAQSSAPECIVPKSIKIPHCLICALPLAC